MDFCISLSYQEVTQEAGPEEFAARQDNVAATPLKNKQGMELPFIMRLAVHFFIFFVRSLR